MRVLQVAHGFPPLDRAGAEIFAHGLSCELRRQGHEVEVFCGRRDDSIADLEVESVEVDGLPVVRINRRSPQEQSFRDTYLSAGVRAAFAAVLERLQPEIVEIHHLAGLSVDLVDEAFERRVPVIFTLHDYWLICQRGQFLKPDLSLCSGQDDGACARCFAGILGGSSSAQAARWLETRVPKGDATRWAAPVRRALGPLGRAVIGREKGSRQQVAERMEQVRQACSRVERFIAPSRYLLERHLELGIPRDRLVFSRYGFDQRGYDRERRQPDGEVRFGYIGSWIPPKGVHVALEAFKRLQNPRASLYLYGRPTPYDGDDSYETKLRKYEGTEGVFFCGDYEHSRVGEILAGLDVLVFPSIWFENSPLVIQEAGLAGLPVLASDLGAIPELVEEGKNGLLFRARDAGDLALKMGRLFDEEGLLDRLRSGSRRKAGSLEDCAREREEIYREVLRQSQP